MGIIMGKRIETLETIIATIILLCFIGFVIYIFSAIREIFINVVYKKTLTAYEREKRDEWDKKNKQKSRDKILSNISSYRPTDMSKICSEIDFIRNPRSYLDKGLTDIQRQNMINQRIGSFLHNRVDDYKDIYVEKVPLTVLNAGSSSIYCKYENSNSTYLITLSIHESRSFSTYRINPMDYNIGDVIKVSGFFDASIDSDGDLHLYIDKISEISKI